MVFNINLIKGHYQKSRETDIHKKIIRGRDINRYSLVFGDVYVKFDKNQLWSNTNEDMFLSKEKIILRQTSDRLIGTYDDIQYFTLDTTHLIMPQNFNIKYLLGVFNSKLLNYYYHQMIPEIGRTFAEVKIVNIKQLPIKVTTEDNENKVSELVDKMLNLNKQKSQLLTPYFNLCENKKTEDRSLKNVLDCPIIDATSSKNINPRFWHDDKYAKFDVQLDSKKRVEIIGLGKDKDEWESLIRIAGRNYDSTLHLYYCIRYVLETRRVNNKTLEAFARYIKIPVIKPNPHIEIPDKIVTVFREKFKDIDLPGIEKNIKETDNQIDEMVYDLYGLTEEEKEIIRNG